MSWMVTFYNRKIQEGLLQWPYDLRAKLTRILELIQEYGGDLGMPLTRAMGDGLFEIRVKAKEGIGRVFFAYIHQQEIIILHSFIKKTQETPKKELEIAQQRLKEVRNHESLSSY